MPSRREPRVPLSPEQRADIVEHMNQDHGEALLLYARVYGARSAATSARMLDIDNDGMELSVGDSDGVARVRIEFERPLAGMSEVRKTLVAMAAAARSEQPGIGRS